MRPDAGKQGGFDRFHHGAFILFQAGKKHALANGASDPDIQQASGLQALLQFQFIFQVTVNRVGVVIPGAAGRQAHDQPVLATGGDMLLPQQQGILITPGTTIETGYQHMMEFQSLGLVYGHDLQFGIRYLTAAKQGL